MTDRDKTGTVAGFSDEKRPLMRYGIAMASDEAPITGTRFMNQGLDFFGSTAVTDFGWPLEDRMSPRFGDLLTRRLLALLAPFAVLLVIGLAGRLTYPHHWIGAALADATFEAFAIAGVLGIVIELFSLKRLIVHVADELAGRLTGYGLPRELQALMSETLKTGLVLHNVVKTYRLVDRADGAFDVEMTHEYEVINYGDELASYKPHLSEESIYDPRFCSLGYGPIGNENSYDAAALRPLTALNKNGRAMFVEGPNAIRLRPFRDSPHSPDKCRVFWRWVVMMPREYSDIIAFGLPAIGVTVRLIEGPVGVVFFVGGPGVTAGSGDSNRHWVSRNAFLPSQHLRVWWRAPDGAPNG
jgi:hypothetical protein